jgi:putative endonuclease
MRANRKKAYRFGLKAEKIAAWYLRLKGYRVLAERYHIMQGEIDVLAARGKTLVAVEVKARQNFAACEDSITPWKQKKILKAVEYILSGSGKIAGLANAQDYAVRFDAIWIVPRQWPRHVKNAWRL